MTIKEWRKDFEKYVNELPISRDDYRAIIEYINEGYSILQSSKEPVAPIARPEDDGWTEYFCGNCKRYLFLDDRERKYYTMGHPKYCSECGREAKWE